MTGSRLSVSGRTENQTKTLGKSVPIVDSTKTGQFVIDITPELVKSSIVSSS
jgi:hypothetical protein